MKPPSFRTWLLGSRFTAPPILLGSAWYVRQWWQAGGADNTGIFALALMLFSARAAYNVATHRRWRADWRAMAPGGDQPRWRPKPATIAAIFGTIVISAALLWATNPDAPPQVRDNVIPFAILSAMAAGALMLSRALHRLWAWPQKRRPARLPAVTLAIRRPVWRAPSIRTCYRRLPPHCQTLLKGRS